MLYAEQIVFSSDLNPILAARLNWIAGQIEELGGTPVFSHGDASPARVLTDGTQLWLTNFERACGGFCGGRPWSTPPPCRRDSRQRC